MNFCSAVYKLLKGKQVRRESWTNQNVSIEIVEGLLSINTDLGTTDAWILSIDDLEADDWVELSEDSLE